MQSQDDVGDESAVTELANGNEARDNAFIEKK